MIGKVCKMAHTKKIESTICQRLKNNTLELLKSLRKVFVFIRSTYSIKQFSPHIYKHAEREILPGKMQFNGKDKKYQEVAGGILFEHTGQAEVFQSHCGGPLTIKMEVKASQRPYLWDKIWKTKVI